MGELATQGSAERKDVLAKLATLTEEQQYDLFEELWEGKHRRTFFQVKPKMEEVEEPSFPPGTESLPPTPPPGRDPSYLTESDLMEERPLPFRRPGIQYVTG